MRKEKKPSMAIDHFSGSQSYGQTIAKSKRDDEDESVIPQIERGEPSSSIDPFVILLEKINYLQSSQESILTKTKLTLWFEQLKATVASCQEEISYLTYQLFPPTPP